MSSFGLSISSIGLSMLYEILVAESKYECRGVEYRSRLKSVYNQMLREHENHHEPTYKLTKQCFNKYIEALGDSVRVLDPTEIQSTDLELCYGIHQYVFPKIPEFTLLDFKFLDRWNKFYNVLPAQFKQTERRIKRMNEKQKTYQMIKRRYIKDSDSSSESDESNIKSNDPILITEHDFYTLESSVTVTGPPDSTNDSNSTKGANEDTSTVVPSTVTKNTTTKDIKDTEGITGKDTKDSEDTNTKEAPFGAGTVGASTVTEEHINIDENMDIIDSNIIIPILTNKEVEINEESIVFGMMDEEKLNDWVSTTSFDNYLQLFKLIYHYDNTLDYFNTEINSSVTVTGPPNSNGPEVTSMDTSTKDPIGPSTVTQGKGANFMVTECTPGKRATGTVGPSTVTPGKRANNTFSTTPKGANSMGTKCTTTNSTNSSNSSNSKYDMLDINDFYKKSNPKVLSSNFIHNLDHFDPNSIYGNYYLPNSSVTVTGPTATTVTEVTSTNNITTTPTGASTVTEGKGANSTAMECTNTKDSKGVNTKETPIGVDDDEVDEDTSIDGPSTVTEDTVMEEIYRIKSYSINFMEVNTKYYYNSRGLFEVHSNAYIKEPFISRIMKGNIEQNTGLYQELQLLLKRIFSLKRKITGNCLICSGWNLLHGIALTFCEYCEDKIYNSDPSILLKIYEIRRYLVSTVYPIVGYNYNTTNLFINSELIKDWEHQLKLQNVSIQSLINVGSTFPKASLHDSRFLPNPILLPFNICNTINTFQFPKINHNTITNRDILDSSRIVDSSRTVDSRDSVDTADSMNTEDPVDIENDKEMDIEYIKSEITTPNNYTSSNINNTHSIHSTSVQSTSSLSSTQSINSSTSSTSSTSTNSMNMIGYNLMDIINYRRNYRGKLLNDFFEDIYNNYHSKLISQRSNQLINHYNYIIKSGLLPSTPNVILNSNFDGENTSTVVPSTVTPGKGAKDSTNSVDTNTKGNSSNSEGVGEGSGTVGASTVMENKNMKEYYDENVSYILSRLPLDNDLIKLSFYHRGIYLTKSNNLKTFNFIHIAKIFGFHFHNTNGVSNSTVDGNGTMGTVDTKGVNTKSTDDEEIYNWHEILYRNINKENYLINNQQLYNYNLIHSFINQTLNTDTMDNTLDTDMVIEDNTVIPGTSNTEDTTSGVSDTVMEDNTLDIDMDIEENSNTNGTMGKGANGTFDTTGKGANSTAMECTIKDITGREPAPVTDDTVMKNIIEELYEKELLQNMHTIILKNFINTRKLKIGYPTSLEMYILNIPDSIMDCNMYDGIGKGFSYSLENIIYNLALLSSFIKIGTVNKRKKYYKSI
ncbi:uncharacterized protein TA13970 [Theileria annulata]|uniref:Uncharacterized protein n=1 Tax=Theileria annulata TaxID=5874 RepID=Q4UET5_THEAN|nr:uncharacterized protein TA13970 [Theileria annulata]CAI74404.1 hypothetical protein, conserved [Theileria annulata]|eukprot:XP_952136.1 hypothetical protein, conserved [Theileria annulata]